MLSIATQKILNTRSFFLKAVSTLCLLAFFYGCAAQQVSQTSDQELYDQALLAIKKSDYFTASTLLEKINSDFPYSRFASNALLLNAYIAYLRQNYETSVSKIDLYTALYPASKAIPYVLYMRALSFFERMDDPNHDQYFTLQAKEGFERLVRRFPNTVYAQDARLRYDSILENLAAHEMNIGRFYQSQLFFISAITHYQTIINFYDHTTLLPEALHRLVESYLSLGITEEAVISYRFLIYNFPASSWAQKSQNLLLERDLIDPINSEG